MLTYKHGYTPIRNQIRRSPLEVALQTNNVISVHIDNKIVEMANYLCARVIQQARHPVEIGFIFGGKVQSRIRNNMTYNSILIDDIYVPKSQTITGATFHMPGICKLEARNYFSTTNRQFCGVGHSHARFETFHSQADYDNCKSMIYSDGIRFSPGLLQCTTPVVKTYTSRQRTILLPAKTTNGYRPTPRRIQNVPRFTAQSRNYLGVNVMPSLVFNETGNNIHAILPTSITYRKNQRELNNELTMHDLPVNIYNKGRGMTQLDKQMLDRRIRSVLSYAPNRHLIRN